MGLAGTEKLSTLLRPDSLGQIYLTTLVAQLLHTNYSHHYRDTLTALLYSLMPAHFLCCRRLRCSSLFLPLLLAHPYRTIVLSLHEVTAEYQTLQLPLSKASMSHSCRYYCLCAFPPKEAMSQAWRLGGLAAA